MKKLLLGIGSFAAAAAPVAAVVACGSSSTTTTGTTGGSTTGGSTTGGSTSTGGSTTGGSVHHVTTSADINAELTKITSINLDASPSLKEMKAGALITLVKTKITEEIAKNSLLSTNSTEITPASDIRFRFNNSKVEFQWQATGTVVPTGFYVTEIKGLDVTGLTTVGKQIMLAVQSSKTVNLIELFKTKVRDSNNSIYVSEISIADSAGQDDVLSIQGKWMSSASGAFDEMIVPTGSTIVDEIIKTYVPLLTDADSAKIIYEYVAIPTTKPTISIAPIPFK